MQELLAKLSSLNAKLELRDGKLSVNAPAGVLTPELQKEIAAHKEALIARLQETQQTAAELDDELPPIVPDPARCHEPFPLNPVQHAYWIGRSTHIELGEVSTHIYFEFESGQLDPARLSAALNKVVSTHGMLRALIDDNGQQRVLESVPEYDIASVDLRGAGAERREAELGRVRAEMSTQVFPCDRWPLFEVRLIQLHDHQTRLCVSWDFLVVDAWSMMLIFQQWRRFYDDPAFQVAVPALSFRDYVLAEARLESLPSYQRSKKYWWDRIDTLPDAPQLPIRHKIEVGRKHEFTRRRLRLEARKWEEIKARGRKAGVTPTSVLLAAFAEVLNRWTKVPHYSLNLTLFNRLPMHEDVGAIVGDFTNVLALEVDGRGPGSFAERASRIQAQFLADFDHRRVSAVHVMRELVKRRGLQQRAFLPVVFTSTLMLDGKRSQDASVMEAFGPVGYGIGQTPQVWFDYQVFEMKGDLVINWDAVEEVFLPGVLDEMFESHAALLESLAADAAAWERPHPLQLPAAQQRRREEANDTAAEIVDRCLHESFVENALRWPDRIAIESSAGPMTYGTLLAHAASIAGELTTRGVRPNELVAIVMWKGWEQIAAALGILLAGGAYLPIDPRWPTLRRNYLLEQGEARIVLTQPPLEGTLEWPAAIERIAVAAQPSLPPVTAAPLLRQSISDLAYVIFTSGSTGTPKGVMIDHRGAVNTVVHINRLFGLTAEDKVLAVSDLGFDLSVWDLFGLLAAGGTVVVPDAEQSRDPRHWHDLIARHGVTVWNSAPPLMGVLVDAVESEPRALEPLRLVMLSGDWIPVPLPDRIRRLCGARVISLGGATEGSIWSIYYPVADVSPDWDSIPYGKALPNQHMYVLDRELQPSPDLVRGDVYIGGLGVALGYWKDPEKTRKQFMAHPATGEPLYATGDLGRMHRDGNIEFLGREDAQVKLRGHRVELGEITACIQSCPGVRDAAVQVVKEDGRSSLVAWIVADAAERSALFETAEAASDALELASRAIESAARAEATSADRDGLRAFWQFWQDVDRVSVRSMLETLQELGIAGGANASVRLDEAVGAGRVLPQYRRLIGHWLSILTERGVLIAREGGYDVAVPAAASGPSAAALVDDLDRVFGNEERIKAFAEHVVASIRQQRALLAGEVTPLSLLFPEGARRVAEALYQTNPAVRHHNRVMASIVRSLVGGWDGERALRILDIGAGTGGATSYILPELPAARTEYWYTDISTYFFLGAKEKFGAYPFVHYAVFDLNKDPKAQGHQPHGYDLIITANVLHTAVDLDVALAGLRALLRPGGFLLALDATRTSPWMWATVGYLEAFETHADARGDAEPALRADVWRSVLTGSGFEAVHVFPEEGTVDADVASWLQAMPQHVFAARAPRTVSRFRPDELSAYLRERLPDYMVPQRYLLLDALPLTANGKIDVAALPKDVAAARPAAERRVIAPRSEVEERILKIWRDVLGIEQLSVTDNFFEMGGDSLLITEVLRRINQFQQPALKIVDVFSYSTILSLADFIASRGAAPALQMAPRAATSAESRDVAVIGLAGRFPDAANVDQLWENLAAGRCAVRQFTEDELLRAGVTAEELAQENYVRAGLVLENLDRFDAAYFSVTPRDAEIMDPQQRFLLECAVEALENAGYPNETHAGRIGVFAGKGTSLYLLNHILPHPDIVPRLGLMPVLNLNEKDFAATLVSYKLDLTGPSINVATACSTSLVAVHLACQSLLARECEIALAGGVSFVSTSSRTGYPYQEGMILSPDGYCRPFSDDAFGTIFGSGAALVVLKPLAAALRDGDTIHAVIKGSAINNDGGQKVGFTAPNAAGQAEVIARAHERAGATPQSVQFIEAHGTATNLGDVIEFGALRQVFGGARLEGAGIALGSVKSNIGHLDAAAGVTGLIKVVQALAHRQIPPTLHAAVPSRRLDFGDSPFYLNPDLVDWPSAGTPRRAGVSSFGVGGTNAHVIVDEAPPVPAAEPPGASEQPGAAEPRLLPLSAKNERSLRRIAHDLAEELARRPELPLDDVAFTLQVGRNAHPYRTHVVADTLGAARAQLADAARLTITRSPDGARPSVAFLFPGQGAQQRDATSVLYETRPRFRTAFDECADLARQFTGIDLRAALYTKWQRDAEGSDLDQTAVAQPLLFAIEWALTQFWASLGVRPAAMLGHSIGEWVAACVAGVFSLPEAMSLVLVRGQLLQGLEPGRMLAAGCGETRLRALLAGSRCDLAAVNGPSQCVVSGPAGAIDELQRRLEAEEIPTRALRTSHAFHSSMVEPVLATFEQCVEQVERNRPSIPFISNVTGTWITDEQATSPAYWARHLRATVRFADGIGALATLPHPLFLEVGPGNTLTKLVGRIDSGLHAAATLRSGRAADGEGADGEARAVLDAAGRLWTNGVQLDWSALHEERRPRRIPLPAYAFDRKRYWIERRAAVAAPAAAEIPADALEPLEPGDDGRADLASDYVRPSNEFEAKLVDIWRAYLGVEKIGVRDSFFDLGGDSLLATRIHAQIRRDLNVELPLAKMFEFTTIRSIYLYTVISRNPDAIEELSADELDECLAMLQP